MLVPVIKIKEKCGDEEQIHIVGSNSHDMLFIKDNAIHYLNLQGMVGTRYPEESGMYFDGKEADESFPYMVVEMVTIEEFIKIAEENMKEQTEASIKLHEALREYLSEREKCLERLDENNINDTSGILL